LSSATTTSPPGPRCTPRAAEVLSLPWRALATGVRSGSQGGRPVCTANPTAALPPPPAVRCRTRCPPPPGVPPVNGVPQGHIETVDIVTPPPRRGPKRGPGRWARRHRWRCPGGCCLSPAGTWDQGPHRGAPMATECGGAVGGPWAPSARRAFAPMDTLNESRPRGRRVRGKLSLGGTPTVGAATPPPSASVGGEWERPSTVAKHLRSQVTVSLRPDPDGTPPTGSEKSPPAFARLRQT